MQANAGEDAAEVFTGGLTAPQRADELARLQAENADLLAELDAIHQPPQTTTTSVLGSYASLRAAIGAPLDSSYSLGDRLAAASTVADPLDEDDDEDEDIYTPDTGNPVAECTCPAYMLGSGQHVEGCAMRDKP